MDKFIAQRPERKVGLVAFFTRFGQNVDHQLAKAELEQVDPSFALTGTNANGDGIVCEGRSRRGSKRTALPTLGLGEFFQLIDADYDTEGSRGDIQAAHDSGQLPVE